MRLLKERLHSSILQRDLTGSKDLEGLNLRFSAAQKGVHMRLDADIRNGQTQVSPANHLAGHQGTDQGIQEGERGLRFQKAL